MDEKQTVARTLFQGASAVRLVPGRFPVVEIRPGTIIAPPTGEPWLMFEPLGEGGHGAVWKALPLATVCAKSHPELTGFPVVPPTGAIWQCNPAVTDLLEAFAEGEPHAAIKLLHLGQVPAQFQPEMVNRLAREAHICGTANEPQIPRLLAFRRAPIPFLAMELVVGETLESYLNRVRGERGYVPWSTISTVLGDIFDALSVIHGMSVVHRDLKPSNFMMARSAGWRRQVLKLIDFGIAKLLPEEQLSAVAGSPKTATTGGGGRRAMMEQLQSTVGTLHMFTAVYAAWEQHDPPGRQTISYATDLFAVGCMAYEMVTGRMWLPETTDIATIRRAMTRPVPEIRHQDLGRETCAVLRAFLQWLLQPDQRHRPQRVREALGGSRNDPTLTAVRQAHRAEGGPPPVPSDA